MPFHAWADRNTKPRSEQPYHSMLVPDGNRGAVWLCEDCERVWVVRTVYVHRTPRSTVGYPEWVKGGRLVSWYHRSRWHRAQRATRTDG